MPEVEIDGAFVLAATVTAVLWVAAWTLLGRGERRGSRLGMGVVLLLAPSAFLLAPVRTAMWRAATGLVALRIADLRLALAYAAGVIVVVALAAAVLALVLCAIWLIQELTERLIALYQKLFPFKVTPAEQRAARRRALFDTSLPHMRSSTYVVSTSPLDPARGSVIPAVPTAGRCGPVLRPPASRWFTDGIDGSFSDFDARSAT